MAYETAHIDAVLAVAIGDDPILLAQVRHAFLQTAREHVQVMVKSATISEWHMAAWRFKGLCESFGFTQLTDLAERATVAAKGDPGVLRKIQHILTSLSQER